MKDAEVKGYFFYWGTAPKGRFFCCSKSVQKNKPADFRPDNILNITKKHYNVNNFGAKLTIFCVLHNLHKLFLCIFSYSNVKASDEYLPITYKTVRYTGGDNTGTTIWYSIIPPKYKMHYAYANDLIGGKTVDGETKLATETPSTNAIRHNATLGIVISPSVAFKYKAP